MVETYLFNFRSPPPTTTADLNHHHHDRRRRMYPTMPLKDLTILRITRPPPYLFGFNRHPSINPRSTTMADQPKKADTHEPEKVNDSITSFNSKEDEKAKGSKKPTPASIPPPPEKPEPGDCCGSGCVRCVWDVYYEELEEYDRLYNTKSA